MYHGTVILNNSPDIPTGMRRSDAGSAAGRFTRPPVSNLQEARGLVVRLRKKGGTDDET